MLSAMKNAGATSSMPTLLVLDDDDFEMRSAIFKLPFGNGISMTKEFFNPGYSNYYNLDECHQIAY